jgi:hypothetical protein
MLISCPECNKQVSDQATNCPGCGFPVEKMKVSAPRAAQPPLATNPLVYVVPANVANESPRGSSVVCPACQSDNVRRMGLLFLEGKSSGGGSTFGFINNLKGGVALTSAFKNSHMQSELSKTCAPPDESDFTMKAESLAGPNPGIGCGWLLLHPIVGLVGGFVLAAMLNAADAEPKTRGLVLGLYLLAGAIHFFVFLSQKTKAKKAYNDLVTMHRNRLHAEAMTEYEKRFMCMKCGSDFIPT